LSVPSDEVLLAGYREGDSAAFAKLLGRYRGLLFTFLLRSVRERGPAEELYQDVWMRVIERCGEFRGDAKFSTWLYTIARNLSTDHQRKMRLRGHAYLDAAQPGSNQPMGEHLPNPGPPAKRRAESASDEPKTESIGCAPASSVGNAIAKSI
jgi:RNA polymerase sigma-70 factor, ECF subfamily